MELVTIFSSDQLMCIPTKRSQFLYSKGYNQNTAIYIDLLKFLILFNFVNELIGFIINITMDKKTLLVFITLLASAALFYSHHEQQDDFLLYKKAFNFHWTVEEESFRRFIYLKNVEIIQNHNADQTQTYKMGVNQFTAITDAEFAAIYLNPRQTKGLADKRVYTNSVVGDVDWTVEGKVSPIKNQGNCGSCWAFSAVGILQSWALFKGETVSLSEQQLVDCSGDYDNFGCHGGFNWMALYYVKDLGITDQKSYPYVGKNQICAIDGGPFKIKNVVSVRGCQAIQNAIQSHPVGVSADATNWTKYASGIFNKCADHLNHDVLLVGYTSTYYKIKNSWGTTWGQKGFIRLAPGNTCGICDERAPWVN